MLKHNILLVEDDEDFGFMLQKYLSFSDFTVNWIADPRII